MAQFKKVHTLNQIKADPRVESVDTEYGDGFDSKESLEYWIYLKDGFVNTESNTSSIHTGGRGAIKQACFILNNYIKK
jgi:hypothetical protein